MKNLLLVFILGCTASNSLPAPDAGMSLDATPADSYSEGRVYHCTNKPDISVVEFCWNGTQGGMEDQLAPIGTFDWTCTTLTTCTYACPNASPGCNAKNGCWCPHG